MRSSDSRHHCCSHTFSRSLMPGHRRLPIHATSAEQQEADVQHERLQRGQKEKDTRLHKAPSPESMARTASCRVIHHVKCLILGTFHLGVLIVAKHVRGEGGSGENQGEKSARTGTTRQKILRAQPPAATNLCKEQSLNLTMLHQQLSAITCAGRQRIAVVIDPDDIISLRRMQ